MGTYPPIEERTAIVHDWFQGFHGSERVVETMRTRLFAVGNDPDIFTFQAARELLPSGLSEAIISDSRLARLPGVRQRGHNPGRWRLLLPYMPYYFDRLPLKDYELVISSSHAFAANVRTRPGALHVCYCYTPLRYAWLPHIEARATGVERVALRLMRDHLRRVDLGASTRPHLYVAISEAVRERIRRFYSRDAVVVHPPVDLDQFHLTIEKERGHFLWVHRMVSYKRPELVVEAFRGSPYRLTMVGVGPLVSKLRRTLPPNVSIFGWLSPRELARLFANCCGFIHIAEEDFGISMVEALASGTPVIAISAGGARDIVRHNVDGVIIERAEVGTLRKAMDRLVASEWDAKLLAARASEFSTEKFTSRLRQVISDLAEAQRAPTAA